MKRIKPVTWPAARWLLVLVAALGACDSSAVLGARVRNDVIVLRNDESYAIYYFIVERETSVLIDWIPCVDPATCPRVPSRQSVTVPLANVIGYRPGATDAIVYWWRLERVDSRYRPDSVRSRIVPLR